MGKVSRWTYTVILLCLCRVGLCQQFPGENPSNGYRNAPPKLNIRNLFGSKLVQRLADSHNNAPQFEQYPYEQQMVQPPPLPPPPPPSRGMIPFEFQNQRMQVQALPPPPPVPVRTPPPNVMGPPQSINQENVYTETITSSCPCPECAAAGNQDYPYQDERGSYVEEECPCERGCPCACDEGYVKGSHPCPCGSRCPFYNGGNPGYQPERNYPEREQNYDDYHPPCDCPCCCSGNQDCPCSYAGEPEGPPPNPRSEPPSYRAYPPVNQMNERFIEGPPEPQMQRHSESFVTVMGQPPYQPPPSPREIQQPPYKQYSPVQYEEVPEEPQYIKMQSRVMTPRNFVPHSDCPEADIQHQPPPGLRQEEIPQMSEVHERVIQRTQMTEVAERPVHQLPEVRTLPAHMMGPPPQPIGSPNIQDNVYTETISTNCPCQTCGSCSECEAAGHMPEMQQGHVPEVPQRPIYQELPPRMPVQSYQEPLPRIRGWRRRMPPPRRMIEEEEMEEDEPLYRSYKPILNRRQRKFRQSARPPFFDGLSFSDGC